MIPMAIVLGQNWEASPVLSSPGDWMPVAIATDGLCQPRVAFGVSGSGLIGYANKEGDTWHYEYPDSGGSISSIALCLDSADLPHMSYVVDRYPEPNELRYAYRDGDTWCSRALVQNATLYSFSLSRDGAPHITFLDSENTVEYAYEASDTWHFFTVPASQPDTLRLLGGASLALDTNDRPGVAVTWTKHGNHDSLWLSFFEFDGQDWHRFDIDSTEGWAPWDFWPVRVRYDPASDLFHVVYRAYRYATGKGQDWQVEAASVPAGNVFCDFVLYEGWPNIICASSWDPLTFQWQRAGGWGTETVRNGDEQENISIAVDRTGRVHIVFQPFGSDTLYYARRLVVGAEEPAGGVHPEDQLLIRPNPAPHAFTVELYVPRRIAAAITLSDATGRTVISQKVNAVAGSSRRRIVLPASVRPGVYFCTFDDGCCRTSRKVVLTD
jgi:hypothetical protein